MNYYKFEQNCRINMSDMMMKKLSKRPKRSEQSKKQYTLYDDLNLFDKIKILFKHDHDLLMKLYPNFTPIMFVIQLIMILISLIAYSFFSIELLIEHKVLGIIALIGSFIYLMMIISLFIEGFRPENNDRSLMLMQYIVSIFSFALPIILIQTFIVMYVFNQKGMFKNYVTKGIEEDCCNHFNQIFYDSDGVAYLRHELIKNVYFDPEINQIKYNYIQKYYHLCSLYLHHDNQFKKVMKDYIKNHTSRELNFKQIFEKLIYLNHITKIDQSSHNAKQVEKDCELLDQISKNQFSKDEILKKQIDGLKTN